MKKTVLHITPVLPEDSRQQTIALAEANMLNQLVTYWIPVKQKTGPLWSLPGLRKFNRRRPMPVNPELVTRVPSADVFEQIIRFSGGSWVDGWDKRVATVDKAAMRMIKSPIRIIFAREDGCVSSFQFGKTNGICCLYDLPIAHYKTLNLLMERESACFPGLDSYSAEPRSFTKERTCRKDKELSLADAILCPSDFVRKSLLDAGIASEKIHVLPFATEPRWLSNKLPSTRKPLLSTRYHSG